MQTSVLLQVWPNCTSNLMVLPHVSQRLLVLLLLNATGSTVLYSLFGLFLFHTRKCRHSYHALYEFLRCSVLLQLFSEGFSDIKDHLDIWCCVSVENSCIGRQECIYYNLAAQGDKSAFATILLINLHYYHSPSVHGTLLPVTHLSDKYPLLFK